MTRVEVFVAGVPRPQGSKDHVGRGRLIESSKYVGAWRDLITVHLLGKRGSFAQYVPVRVDLLFTVPAPKNLPVHTVVYPTKIPDLDKLVRAVYDAITKAGVWHDDSQAVESHEYKTYPFHALSAHDDAADVPGVRITLTEIGGL